MSRYVVFVAAAALGLGAATARAQQPFSDTAGALAGAVEELGQSIGQAAFAGPNVFVTAKGSAKLPSPLTDSYYVSLEGKNASAVAAVQERDRRILQVMDQAKRIGVQAEVGETSIVLEVDSDAQQRLREERTARMQANMQLHTGVPFAEPFATAPKVFVAKASLRFRTPSSANLAVFLDALHGAGADDISRGLGGPVLPFLPQKSEFMGFGSVDTLAPALWSAAGEDAMRNAQTQAQALAAAAGGALGPVRQITVLTRSIENGAATESLAVRFGLGVSSH